MMVFEGLKKRIAEGVEQRRQQAEAAKEQAKTQKAIYTSTYKKTYTRARNKATYKAAISQAQRQAEADVARSPQGGGRGSFGTVGTTLGTGARGFKAASKYGKTDPFGVMGSGGGGTDYGLGSLLGGGEKRSSKSSQPDYLGLGSIGLGEPARTPHRKKSSKGKTITIRIK